MITIYHEEEVPLPWRYPGQWSFPVSEVDYLLETHDKESFVYYKGRLYEWQKTT